MDVLGEPINPNYHPPSVYTGEAFGIEYLYTETEISPPTMDTIEERVEEGLVDEAYIIGDPPATSTEGDPIDHELDLAYSAFITPPLPLNEEEQGKQTTDAKSIPGWDRVVKLAALLIESSQREMAISNAQADSIIELYQQLPEYDKRPLRFSKQLRPSTSRFGSSKGDAVTGGSHVGVEAMKRCFITAGAPSHSPRKSRLVEAVCTRLSIDITSPSKNPYVSRFAKIVQQYNVIRNCIMECPKLVDNTELALFQINETTLGLW